MKGICLNSLQAPPQQTAREALGKQSQEPGELLLSPLAAIRSPPGQFQSFSRF